MTKTGGRGQVHLQPFELWRGAESEPEMAPFFVTTPLRRTSIRRREHISSTLQQRAVQHGIKPDYTRFGYANQLRLSLAMLRAAQVLASATADAFPRWQVARLGMAGSRQRWTHVIVVFECGRLFGKAIACAIHTGHLMTSVSHA